MSFRKSRSILEIEFERLALQVRRCHIDLESLRLEFYAKKISPIVAFLSLTVTFLRSIAAFSCKKNFVSTRFRGPYSGVFKPYSDVLKPYSSIFLQFMEIESLKLDFHIDFFFTLYHFSFKSRLKNSSFILELEF